MFLLVSFQQPEALDADGQGLGSGLGREGAPSLSANFDESFSEFQVAAHTSEIM